MNEEKKECTIDHTLEDLKGKLQPFLALEFGTKLAALLDQDKFNQEQLNELFHHLKKLHKYQDKINDLIREAE
ncbi:hypothetical protein [Effusibacillus lacus]|uniref:Group-specific protein n=1 Tax=Effusibacillus lacus TaxID=1348429 RepID=A0A292YJB1_9BACL|nr:hypothetical protein [Effusibacillus lacus]TCS72829.1 hypothetical protein EDD64_12044 [Effusibacillus lacus]GAX89246.1 hypothetical protein EFBL_0864 [Effusibacillus lacus]